MKKKIFFVAFVPVVALFFQGCGLDKFADFEGCSAEYSDKCLNTFSSTPDVQSLTLQGGSIKVVTGRQILSTETLKVVLSQGSSKMITLRKEQVVISATENAINISLFQPDLMDFNAGTATLTLTLIPYEGATPQVHVVNLQLN